ncbi:MAG TPA: hypothetical protein VMU09_05555, partial [Acidimicrobiales bacterium]|nr:hypothetical protein [Acidimicrobiales bacterium]
PEEPELAVDPAAAAAEAGVTLSPVELEALAAAARFRARRRRLQEEQLARLATELPLPQLRAPFLFSASIGPDEVGVLADALAVGIAALPAPADADR